MCVFCLVSAQYDLTVKPASLLLSKGCLFVVDVSGENGEDSDEKNVGNANDGEDKEDQIGLNQHCNIIKVRTSSASLCNTN